jgi:hypothetical protein
MSLLYGLGWVAKSDGLAGRTSVKLSFEREPFAGPGLGTSIRHWLLDVEVGTTTHQDVDLTVTLHDTNWIGVYVRGGVVAAGEGGVVAGAGLTLGRDPSLALIPVLGVAALVIDAALAQID